MTTQVFEMNNGCICCTVRGDLMRILNKLSRRETKFDHILIETTGLADPAPVAQTFFLDEDIKASYSLDAIVTVVDCAHIIPHLEENKPEGVENESVEQVREEEKETVERKREPHTTLPKPQVAFADKILLNKVDLVTPSEKAAVLAKIRSINKLAEVIETSYSALDLSRVLGVKAFDLARVLQVEEDFLDTEGEHEHDSSVTSVGITLRGSLELPKLNLWLTTLLQTR